MKKVEKNLGKSALKDDVPTKNKCPDRYLSHLQCSLAQNKKLNTDENSLNILEEEKTKLISNYKELILKYVQTFVLERREGTNEDINKSLPVISYYFN